MTNQIIELGFDLKNNSYKAAEFSEELSSGVTFGIPKNLMGPPSKPINQLTTPITFSNHRIQFFPDGTIQSGSIYLTDSDHRFCFALTLPVASISYLRKYRYDSGAWEII